ncbi:hypothetical protein Cylst_2023 [Cylindrospermum stagnale PCC 7417]|uniref:Uncharacterized protein n=1 Tax=Cylindrospermum stagnale PCC 7417 TaxID=56107 RepID=K9WXL9_9NOST|nr:hypothetical protein [Cylindrospermum stagnale]AFZ24267.1 hypothetical protein Cylst_2023 [Cylindrospermum stagnale PCC 7417]
MAKFRARLQQTTAVGMTFFVSCSLFAPPANANPAILAPAAFCAGTAGIGCVIVGVVAIGGITYYVWEYGGGKRVIADADGNIRRIIDNPDNPGEVGIWEDPLDTASEPKAESICKARAAKLGASYTKRRDPVTRKWICVFTGGTGK